MEQNWNQLIERYLQNELSEEGIAAFEQELQLNPALREELEMHQLIQSAAKRASQRMLIKQTGKLYLRNLRIRQFAIGVVVSAAVTVGIVYLVHKKRETVKPTHQQEQPLAENMEEQVSVKAMDTVAIVQGSDTISTSQQEVFLLKSADYRAKSSHVSTKMVSGQFHEREIESRPNNDATEVSDAPVKTVEKLVQAQRMTDYQVRGEAIQPKKERPDFYRLYDSVGDFNDLYCGYALVMKDSKFGFIDRKGAIFIPLIYDRIVVSSNIQSSRDKRTRKNLKVLYVPKRSGNEVQYCDDDIHPLLVE